MSWWGEKSAKKIQQGSKLVFLVFLLSIHGRVLPSKDNTKETSEANEEGKDESIKKLNF